jgi:adenylate cyclase class 2
MNEIEVKAKLRDKEAVMKQLLAMGLEIESRKYQKDVVYFPNDITDTTTQQLEGKNFLRIREQKSGDKKKVIFTLKQRRRNDLDAEEHELEIQEKDIPEMLAAFKCLGYYERVTVEKNRIVIKMGNIEICIDDVTDLGSFIELEKFGKPEESEKIQSELHALLASWGIQKEDYVYRGYDILMYDSKHPK